MKNKMSVKKIFGFCVKMLLAVVVIAFMGLQSLNFFTFVFPPDQWYYAYLGFGLTSGAVIGYLIIFMVDAATPMQKAISIGMMVISVLGEVMTAGYGIQLEAQIKTGLTLAQSDYDFMVMVVKLLGFAHGLALITYFAGDKIIEAFQDLDHDGIPDGFDKIDNRTGKPFVRQAFAKTVDAENLKDANSNPTNPPRSS